MYAPCPCPLARICWLILTPGMRERLAGLEPEVAEKELEELADTLTPVGWPCAGVRAGAAG